eukprot:TRINITY_DN6892_c0_g2_i1.p1 TRINITY_DN6892_c0_g2~~TRINITY_DN6892_c0_g2_i1.p1  ORF type:complete len:137 (+),score=54.87 TRINITY_DN6892_c0_g2_i1:3-413(+)
MILLLGFIIYSTVLISRLKALMIPDHHKKALIAKLQALVILCTTCYFLHAIALIFSHFNLLQGTFGKNAVAQIVFFILNDILTEFLPFFSILVLLGFFFNKRMGKKTKEEKKLMAEVSDSFEEHSYTSEGRADLVQ